MEKMQIPLYLWDLILLYIYIYIYFNNESIKCHSFNSNALIELESQLDLESFDATVVLSLRERERCLKIIVIIE